MIFLKDYCIVLFRISIDSALRLIGLDDALIFDRYNNRLDAAPPPATPVEATLVRPHGLPVFK